MARLLTDEQFSMRVVDILRRRHGHDVTTVRQLCASKYGDGYDDKTVLEIAHEERRILITDNRTDFRQLHASMPWHSGIVLCPKYTNANTKADLINDVIRDTLAERGLPHFTGQLVSIFSEKSQQARSQPDSI